ncbi:hypothetical protein Tco_1249198 [Tanacetum coccineum]
MITTYETSPLRIISLPSLSLQHTPFTTPSTSQPSNIHTTPVTEEAASMLHESPLRRVHSLGRDEGSLSLHELTVLCTNLSNKVKKLEHTMKTSQSRRRTRVVLSDEEEVSEDPSKQGRSLIEELDLDAEISLVPPHDAKIQEKISDDTEVLLEEEETAKLVEEPTKLMEDQEVVKGEQEMECKKRKDKGKAIMIEDESVQKKFKKQLEQERLSHEEAIRLQEQIDEKERKRIARDAEIAKQLQERYEKSGAEPRSVVEVRKNMIMYLKNQGGYKMKYFKGMSYDDIRPIFEKVWDQVHSFVALDAKKEVLKTKKRHGQDVEAKPAKRQRTKKF